jgi:hypothetical protein
LSGAWATTVILQIEGTELSSCSVAVVASFGLRVSENRVLRGIFGHKIGKLTGGWRKLQNEELHNLYS